MKHKKISPIWKIDKNDLQDIINESASYRQILKKLSYQTVSGNQKTLIKRINEDNLDLTKLNENRDNRLFYNHKIPNEMVFCKKSKYYRRISIKKRMIEDYNIRYECSECGNSGTHNSKPLTLQLDHINGINNDHRIENLRFLCPNCHSQTKTFAGRSHKKHHVCPQCNKPFKGFGKTCQPCNGENRRTVNRPTKEVLEKLIWRKPTSELSKEFGVSDVAIFKWCKSYGISKPPRGYWTKLKFNKL